MNIALWIVQIALALLFVLSGFMKVTQPIETLAMQMKWVSDFSPHMVRLIGVLELLGGIGLILPAWTGIAPILTPLAAVGLALLMVGAIFTNFRHHDVTGMIIDLVVLALAAFVIYGRLLR